MSANCCTPPPVAVDPVYRRILWIALVANAAMFFVEIGAGAFADSTALLADAVDFFGDAANYGISLAVLAVIAAQSIVRQSLGELNGIHGHSQKS